MPPLPVDPPQPRGSASAGPAATGQPPVRVLVVEDDPTVAEVVVDYLRRGGYAVQHVADGDAALRVAAADPPGLVVLDLMLPGIDGLEVCRRLRATGPVPVIMLTALGDESDRVLGLEVGADDYVTKPFSPRELVLRVASVLRRAAGSSPVAAVAPSRQLSAGSFSVDLDAHVATRDGRAIGLTTREFDLLAFLLMHPGKAFSREELMTHVWGWEYGDRSTVTVHIRRLREKIEPDPAAPVHVVTVWGVGYRFDAVPAQPSDAGRPS